MAHFVLQSDDTSLKIEQDVILDLLKRERYLHTYEFCSLNEMETYINAKAYPIGTIQFVSKFLKNNFGIEQEKPIEIPKYLQQEKYLKRNYEITTWDKVPRNKKIFLKDVSVLKEFGNIIDPLYYDLDEIFNYKKKTKYDSSLVLDKTHLYQVSDIIPIQAEFRVYVLDNKIEGITCYEGDPLLYPDAKLLREINGLIQLNEKYLKSYTIDVATGTFGTALLEVHNFTSIGLYQIFWGSDLLYGYVDGINYLLKDNGLKYI